MKPAACLISIALLASVAFAAPAATVLSRRGQTSNSWIGWPSVKYIFAFGDSYSSLGFAPDGPQPSREDPFGNGLLAPPAAVLGEGSNDDGPNYLQYITKTYNQSFIKTYDFAFSGATVSETLVPTFEPAGLIDLQHQIESQFIPKYGSKSADLAPWTATDSLFSIFIGINDVHNSYAAQNKTLNTAIIELYTVLIGELYDTGARNFLIIEVPPIYLSPDTISKGAAAMVLEKADLLDFNARVAAMLAIFKEDHNDITVFHYQLWDSFLTAINSPQSRPLTAGFKNTDGYCEAYNP